MIRGVVLLGGMREKATQSGEEEIDPKTAVRCAQAVASSRALVRAHEPLAQEGAVKQAK